jgi:hypothetical protein
VGFALVFPARVVLGDLKDAEQNERENQAGDGGVGLGEEVHDGDQQKHQRDQTEPQRNFHAADFEIEGHAIFALAGMRVAQHEDRDAFGREAPDHAKRVEVAEERDVAAARDDGDDLHRHDDVDQAVRSAVLAVRLAEPIAEHAVFGNAIQHAV